MTGGIFAMTLGRMAEMDVNNYRESSFTDVKAGARYMGYVEWVVKQRVVKGATAGTPAPDGVVTRGQMADMTANYTKAIGCNPPETHKQSTFADAAATSTWAADSVKTV